MSEWSDKILSFRMVVVAMALSAFTGAALAADGPANSTAGSGSHEDLVALFHEFLEWKMSHRGARRGTEAARKASADDVFPNHSPAVVNTQQSRMREFQDRLADIGVQDWAVAEQADYLAVRSRFDQQEFMLRVSRPWARDPGFYVDRTKRIAFTELPLAADDVGEFRVRLAAVTVLLNQARQNLSEVAADYADLAIFNLTTADGVGHGHPYRPVPPAGVIGWYDDLSQRARREQPELLDDITAARQSIVDFHRWLVDNRSRMTGSAGVGKANFDWYLKHVKLMPYTADEIVVLGQRELDRLWSGYALERHRNRNLPEIQLPSTAEEYKERIADTDRRIRDFLVDEEIITIPPFIGELGTNVPWIERPGGPNFWEQVQFRDPTPDHLHAVIPGHRFDGVVERHNEHPIRGKIMSGARAEGWGVYLEEGMMNAGLLDDLPRVRELIYVFGIFRAARVPADVWLQSNEMTADEVVDWWMERTPWLDRDVARVDAEIYLRRPPGYGLGYTVGMLQMQRLLADRRRQLGDDFVLKDFHDEFMAAGRLPMSLIRWQMTGLDDEVSEFWARDPLP